MSRLNGAGLIAPISSFPARHDGGGHHSRISRLYGSSLSAASSCHGFWHNAALVIPSALFIAYLGFQAKRNIKKLRHSRSYVMIAYYVLLWFSALFGLAWSSLQAWQCAPGKEIAWNLLSLFTTAGMMCLEISIVAFLLQENYATGLETLAHTFMVSGIFVGVDIFLKAICIFGLGIPLFIDVEITHQGKWEISFMYKLLFLLVYGYILFVHYSKWRDKLPPRPAFYNYVIAMFVFNAIALCASGLTGIGSGFGLWLYNFTVICYHTLYLPLLYVTFLADFFQEEEWLLDSAYYSEMRDAGFFDADLD
ncbi:hypothetical protein M9H77_34295 [Catharanthus roseus]|uniref:Uncharacterized protein n=1 Tax=Catharanthus roseus TaxID=4058 RepID=A0ACB9ZL21_CATRO|nr:hypothetical protein M9H77_34295 [Catharanthus roseus]